MAIPLKKYAVNTPYFTPRVDSPDETGEVAHISVPKGGRAVKPAAVALPYSTIKANALQKPDGF